MDGTSSISSSWKPPSNPDVLWEILSLLTAYDQPVYYDSQPLKALRLASHVCTSWRQLILSSPLLWARIVNLDELNQKTNGWRSEVIRRTGDAVLSIKGTGRRLSAKSERFIVHLLQENWHRVKYLQICLSYHSLHRPSVFSQILVTPAPNLEHFAIRKVGLEPGDLDDPGINEVEGAESLDVGYNIQTYHRVTFGEMAPNLKHFSCSELLLPAVARWWFLKVLHLECGEINGRDLFNALPFMHKLETLHVHIIDDPPDIPIIFPECVFLLPHLHDVHITAHSAWLMGLIILVSLEPRPGFQLDFDVYDGDRDIPILENADDIKILWSQVFVKMVTTGGLKDVDDSLEVTLNDDFLYMTIPHKFRLSFFSWDSLPALVGILSIPQAPFLHATQLKIDIIYWEDPESEENIVQFLSSLAQAHSLWVNSDTLAYIHKIFLRHLEWHILPSLSENRLRLLPSMLNGGRNPTRVDRCEAGLCG